MSACSVPGTIPGTWYVLMSQTGKVFSLMGYLTDIPLGVPDNDRQIHVLWGVGLCHL